MVSRIFSWIMFLAFIGIFVFFFDTQIKDGARQLYTIAFPCTQPVTYKIGSIDPRFGISTSTVQKDLQTAAQLWNNAAGKTVIAEDEKNGYVTVSLEYDSRQQMTKRLKALGVTISRDHSSYDSLKIKYDSAFSRYQDQKRKYDSDVATFTADRESYEKEVAHWNSQGGAPRAEYQALQNQKQALSDRADALNNEQDSLNAAAQEVNDLAHALNQVIAALNLNVQKYNTTGQENGPSFEQGLYERQLGVETITIFEYENNLLLIRVLAHELGHALGLEHVEDPQAIMYYLNQGDAIALTGADAAELKAVCRF